MKVGIVVLVRFSSQRLLGKALKKIKGKEILLYILERLRQVVDSSQIIIATSTERDDDSIVKFAIENNVAHYRGSLSDVSSRFYEAASVLDCDFAIRINGDNVFVDSPLLSRMISLAKEDNYDFISNVKNRTYPKGVSIEIVRMTYYASLLVNIMDSMRYKEHVTNYLYEHENNQRFLYLMNEELPEAAGIQLALDTREDWERTVQIIQSFDKPHWQYNLKEILPIWKLIVNE